MTGRDLASTPSPRLARSGYCFSRKTRYTTQEMSVSIGKWSLFWWYERVEPPEGFEEYDPRSAHQWIRTIRPHRDSLPALRRFLAQNSLDDLWRFTDEGVVELLGRKLESRQIRVLVEPEQDHTSHSTPPDSGPAPFPREERTSRPAAPSKTPVVDDAVFPDDAHLVAIAGVLENGSQSAAPFCEECAKAKAASQSA
ncbi:MAG: hypothetical protein LAQ69_11800 [Acidobacteriia bacterium]|nr:hypothetical protein [Terriglobia bacterium]